MGPIEFKNHLEWEVEAILQHRNSGSRTQYLIKWKDHEEKTWLRVSQLQHCAEMLRDYQHEHGLALDYWSESSSSPESQSEEEASKPIAPAEAPAPLQEAEQQHLD